MKWSTQRDNKENINSVKLKKEKIKRRVGLTLYEMCLFSMFGALMFASKKMMEFLPNIHLIGMFIVLITVVYRSKALIPLYIYVFLDGLFGGFSLWWIPYLYIWTVLWGMAMLIPRRIPKWAAAIVYPLVCSLHGFLFGILYAPAQALFFKLTFEQTVAWVLAGSLFDTVHGVSNFFVGLIIFPLSLVLRKINSSVYTRIG